MILIVGGAGYIGSHINKELNKQGFKTVVFDNLSSGKKELVKWGEFFEGDLGKIDDIRAVFKKYPIEAVLHFAAFKAVGESVTDPQKYYKNNVANTLNLFEVMRENEVDKFIFSSSAATFGEPKYMPIDEKHPQNPINPYGETKLIVEHIMRDYSQTYGLKFVALRYFNACGAEPEGEVGEWQGTSSNLIPLTLDAAIGARPEIGIFGTDYETPDGTCIRDYIHVVDLANAHLCALNNRLTAQGCRAWNIGTGNGISVLQVKNTFEQVNGVQIPFEFAPRREGDVATSFADNSRAVQELGWTPQYGLEDMLADSWNWQKQNPNGYR